MISKCLGIVLATILTLGLLGQSPASDMFKTDGDTRLCIEDQRTVRPQTVPVADDLPPSFYDGFNSSFTGFNQSLWDLETYGNGAVSWVGGEQFNMSAERHSFRALSSKDVFSAGQVVNVRLRSHEDEAVLFVGWTNKTAEGWNYNFWGDSVYFQIALSTVLLDVLNGTTAPQRVMLPGFNPKDYHNYRIVWNNTAVVGYVDGMRLGVVGTPIPSTSLHFKIAITEFRNMTTEGWVCLDSISIFPHFSMSGENPPFIALTSPGNGTTNLGGDHIEIVVVGSNGSMMCKWDDDDARKVPISFDVRLPSASGRHVLNLTCKDGYGFDVTSSVCYVFHTQGASPRLGVPFSKSPPIIDGVIQSDWNWMEPFHLSLVRSDGAHLDTDTYLAYDQEFLYVAIDSPVASGHDSRGMIIVDGVCDGHYHGTNQTPMLSLYYNQGSPDAWVGYTELQYLNESSTAGVRSFRISPLPEGAVSACSEVGSHVHYEFRLPLSQFQAGTGSTLGISFLVFPSGMGVDSWFYPMANPWENASRLALADLLAPPLDPVILIVGVAGAGTIAAVIYVEWSRWRLRNIPAILRTEDAKRILTLVQSHDSISIERLSKMTNVPSADVSAIVRALIDHKRIEATLESDGLIIRRA